MTGWAHRYEVAKEISVAVAPTSTTLLTVEVQSHTSLSGVLTNTSLVEEMTVSASESWDGVTRWASLSAINSTQFFETLAPGESRHFQFDCTDLRNVRLSATASGSGLTAIVAVQQVHSLPVR